eukprot:7816383-Pyramimonas_sp.AAC.1
MRRLDKCYTVFVSSPGTDRVDLGIRWLNKAVSSPHCDSWVETKKRTSHREAVGPSSSAYSAACASPRSTGCLRAPTPVRGSGPLSAASSVRSSAGLVWPGCTLRDTNVTRAST